MTQVKYCYTVKENNIQVFRSNLFSTPQEAMDYFLKEDKPAHYASHTFYRSEFGSFLRNNKYGAPWDKQEVRIEVEFKEVYLTALPLDDWRNICADNFPTITEK